MQKCPMCGYVDPESFNNKPLNYGMAKYFNKDNPKEKASFNNTENIFTTRDKQGVEKTWVKVGSPVSVPVVSVAPVVSVEQEKIVSPASIHEPVSNTSKVPMTPVTGDVTRVLAELRAKSTIAQSAAPVNASAPAVVLSTKEPVVDTVNG